MGNSSSRSAARQGSARRGGACRPGLGGSVFFLVLPFLKGSPDGNHKSAPPWFLRWLKGNPLFWEPQILNSGESNLGCQVMPPKEAKQNCGSHLSPLEDPDMAGTTFYEAWLKTAVLNLRGGQVATKTSANIWTQEIPSQQGDIL